MNTKSPLLQISLSLALTLGIAYGQSAEATKLNAQPLPRATDLNRFAPPIEPSQPLQPSRWQRKPDYRDLEAQKKLEELERARQAQEAQRKAIEDSKRNQVEQVENIKKRQQTAIDANNKAVALGRTGNFAAAIHQHELAVQNDPTNKQFRINLSAAHCGYGQQRLAGGDLMGAANCFRKALNAAADNGLAGKLLADCMKKMGRDPGSADVRLATGDQLAAIGDLEGAAVEYQAAMQIEGSARAYVKMGDMALRFGQYSTAFNWYRQAIVKDTEYGPAHRQLGMLQVAQKDLTAAAASLRKAVILDPKDAAAGQVLVEIWRKQVAANPLIPDNHMGLAGALQLTGDFAGANSEYSKLEALDPKNPGLPAGRQSLSRAVQHAKAEKHKLAAETLFNQGLRREALSEISQAVMMEPRNSKFQFLLGECLEANGEFQGAHQAYLTCVLIDPENNKEAAARMREMQNGRGRSGVPTGSQFNQAVNQAANQIVRPQYNPAFAPQQQQQQQQAAPQVQQQQQQQAAQPPYPPPHQSAPPAAMTKNGYEGVGAAQAASATTNNVPFRTHDESPVAPTQSQPAAPAVSPQAAAAAQADAALNGALAQVSDAESQKDYQGAIQILRQLLGKNLQNAEVHHRLAVNLLASAQITEAISEFRIASALNPAKKAYSDDLARCLAIHKRSLMSESASNTGVNGAAQ